MVIKGVEILVIKGDITEVSAEAIVNFTNTSLYMERGVAGIIKKKGGKIIEEEAVKQGPIKMGAVVLTSAGSLKANYVIHAATEGLDSRINEEIIRRATSNALICAQKHKISSIIFFALGYGGEFSYEASSKIMAQEVWRYLRETEAPTLRKIIFVLSSRDAFKIFRKNVLNYIEYINRKITQGPFITVDGILEYGGGIVMVERSNPPLGWALPGGFVDYGESIEDAVCREVKEETNLEFVDFRQFKVYSQPNRDPRFHTISVVFAGRGKGVLKAASDAKNVKVFKMNSLPEKIAFDHRRIIEEYKEHTPK
jgi:8-oxo-dGTP diphosphatase